MAQAEEQKIGFLFSKYFYGKVCILVFCYSGIFCCFSNLQAHITRKYDRHIIISGYVLWNYR